MVLVSELHVRLELDHLNIAVVDKLLGLIEAFNVAPVPVSGPALPVETLGAAGEGGEEDPQPPGGVGRSGEALISEPVSRLLSSAPPSLVILLACFCDSILAPKA